MCIRDSVEHIREIYCHHAVEGISQQEYIAEVLEIPVGKELFKLEKKASVNSLWSGSEFDSDKLAAEVAHDGVKQRKKNTVKKAKSYGDSKQTKLRLSNNGGRSKDAIGGFALCACADCTFDEFRLNTPRFLEEPCHVCGSSIDRHYSDNQLSEPVFWNKYCESCHTDYHALEMLTDNLCKCCYLSDIDMRALRIRGTGTTPKKRRFFCHITKKEWPIALSLIHI